MKSDDKAQVILEEVRGQYKAIMESVRDVPAIKEKVDRMDIRLGSIDERRPVVEEIVKKHSRETAVLKNGQALN